jgi:hypothetical protein
VSWTHIIELLGGDLDGKRFWFGCLPAEWRELLPPRVKLPSLPTTAASLLRVVVYRNTGTVRVTVRTSSGSSAGSNRPLTRLFRPLPYPDA